MNNIPANLPFAEDEHDPWLCREDSVKSTPQFKTWDGFEIPETNLGPATFMTEAGASPYDALLASADNSHGINSHDSYSILDPKGYTACLLALSLGRESVMFSWDPEKRTFLPKCDLIKVPGYSGDSLSGVLRLCTSSGEACRRLAQFIEKTYSAKATPPRIALANALEKILLVVQDELGSRGLRARSIIQLQSLVRPAYSLLSYFHNLASKTRRSFSDATLLSIIYNEAYCAELSEPFLKDTMCEILRMVSKPWAEFVEEWIGLRDEKGVPISKDGPGKSFVRVDTQTWIDDQGFELTEPDFFLDMDNMPTFVPDDVAQAIFETGRNLRFLRAYHPDHLLASPNTFKVPQAPQLEWQFDWESITRVEQKAIAFHRTVSETLRQTRHGSNHASEPPSKPLQEGDILQFFGKDEFALEQTILASIAQLEESVQNTATDDSLSKLLRERLFKNRNSIDSSDMEFSPHWSLLPLLSFGPFVYAQSRLVNRECLRLLYTEHHLREHLRLQRGFQLLGNGMFSSRLSNSLFNPEMDTTERQSGVSRSGGRMGLRLASRENWPPASSELRLALAGVLTESFQQDIDASAEKRTFSSVRNRAELLGDLSFSIRDLSPDEMNNCMDPDSLEALDFLRMSYKPPTPLLPIMTPAVLLKYDRVFRLLLRVLRMLFAVDQLFRDISSLREPDNVSLRFRIEAHQFVSNVARYFFDTGINKPWHCFEAWLDKVEKGLDDPAGDATRPSSVTISPDRLGEQHERTLDDIMAALLLKKRQQPVLRLLEEIFSLTLRFAKQARLRAVGTALEGQDMAGLYGTFREKVEVFITVCRGMSEKVGYGPKRESRAEENPIVMLLLLLDMSNYYVKR